MYNEIEGNYDNVAMSTFKRGLHTDHGLRKSLTRKPVTSVLQLMDRIDKYKRVEEDQQTRMAKQRLSLRREGTSGRTVLTAIIGRKGITQSSLDPLEHRQSMLCSENHYIRSWRR